MLPQGTVWRSCVLEGVWGPMLQTGPYRSEWPVPPLGDIQTRDAAKSHVWVSGPIIAMVCVGVQGLCCHQGPCGCPGSGCHLSPCLYPRDKLHPRQCRPARPALLPDAMVISGPELQPRAMFAFMSLLQSGSVLLPMVPVTTGDRMDAQDLGLN